MEKMAEKVTLMVRTSVKALRDNDEEVANSHANTENEVGKLYSAYLDKLSTAPSATNCIISTILVVRYLERIADHTTYVGEAICYIAKGQKIILG